MLLAKHSIFSVVCGTSLSRQKIHDLSDFLAELCKSLHHIVFVCKLVKDLLDHVSEFVKNAVLQID